MAMRGKYMLRAKTVVNGIILNRNTWMLDL